MKVSLVIPTYNNLRHIKNAYESVRKHYKDIELILIDDGADDGTIEWLESLKDKYLKFSSKIKSSFSLSQSISQ